VKFNDRWKSFADHEIDTKTGVEKGELRFRNMPRVSRKLAVLVSSLILAACYASTLRAMFHLWMTDEDMAHGVLVPLVIAWILYRERARLRQLPADSSGWGWALLATGAALQLASARGAGVFIGAVAFLVSTAGAVVCLGGTAWIRALAFPFALGCFMLPKLAYFYNESTLPLQLLASRLAAAMLTAAGFAVIRAGNLLSVSGHQVSVEAACNGIRYLIPLAFVSLVFSYLARSVLWIRAALVVSAVPIAIASNALRVALSAASPRLAVGDWHTLTGVAVFILALPGILLIHSGLAFVHRRIHD
jgi:exosortase